MAHEPHSVVLGYRAAGREGVDVLLVGGLVEGGGLGVAGVLFFFFFFFFVFIFFVVEVSERF